MELNRRVTTSLSRNVLVMLAVLMASSASNAQFLDMLKDQATKALQKKIEDRPPQPTAKVESQSAAGNVASNGTPASTQTLQAYQGYDFVPGDTIVFEDNFEKDEDGEFPSHWNQGDGQGAVNAFAGRKAFTVTAGGLTQVSPAIKAPKYLSDSWTLEFDTYVIDGVEMPRIFLNPDNKLRGPANFAWSDWVAFINLSKNNFGDMQLQTHTKGHTNELTLQTPNPAFMRQSGFFNQWHHIAVAYREGRIKIYVDQFRVYSLQDIGVQPQALALGSAGERARPGVIANVRIANGAGIKLVDKKFTDAKFVTHGINFDNDKAALKPESMGTLNLVVDILKNNADLRFEVQGHTDNSGGSAHNMALSQQRADAVRQQLIAMGVDTARLSAKGLGDTRPIAENTSPEGRANNRRVEFITIN
jgi:outer membrane protein OmpA-like peptidoglycan-associated protein